MRDNKTSQPAREYDGNVRKTMPYYDCFHDNAINLVEAYKPEPAAWLDAGGGTGMLLEKAVRRFPGTAFTLADPSAAMLEIAQEKFTGTVACSFLAAGTEKLACPDASFDVITAVLAHHYFDAAGRREATRNCYRMLKADGVYINFETVLPASERGKEIGLKMWRLAQLRQGKDEAAVDKHINRFGQEFFPISVAAHLEVLRETGFTTVEMLWMSGMQAGFYAIK